MEEYLQQANLDFIKSVSKVDHLFFFPLACGFPHFRDMDVQICWNHGLQVLRGDL
jgi:hypothetical protein